MNGENLLEGDVQKVDEARTALAQQYRAAGTVAERDSIAHALMALLSAEDPLSLHERLLTWLTDSPDQDLANSADYGRYAVLLPAMLAGDVAAKSADYAWFLDYLERCPACAAEYTQLQSALVTEDAEIDYMLGGPTPLHHPYEDRPKFRTVAEADSEYHHETEE